MKPSFLADGLDSDENSFINSNIILESLFVSDVYFMDNSKYREPLV